MNLVESGLSRIQQKMQDHTCGFISAFRNENTYRQNKDKSSALWAKLRECGYSVTSISGNYIEDLTSQTPKEVSEESYFVCNDSVSGDDGGKLKADLIKYGKALNQDSVIIAPAGQSAILLYLKTPDNSPDEQSDEIGGFSGGKLEKDDQFFSRVHGRPFLFKHAKKVDKLTEHDKVGNIMGRYAMYTMAKKGGL